MVHISELKLIRNNKREVIGCEIFDKSGKSMKVKIQAFIQAIKSGQACIENLSDADKVELERIFNNAVFLFCFIQKRKLPVSLAYEQS